ncbi:MAG: M48 family metallopeptidase [Alphaproteobacteria bacterium]|nr:M48 family metallopeptidase [Alphaproteobacteria bacterium]
MTQALTVDDLHFTVRRSAGRRTLELTVERDGALSVAAPPDVEDAVITDFVREKRFWLYTKLAEKEARQHPTVTKEYVSGEGFLYLGRSYRLLLVDAQERPLKLLGGRFRLRREEAGQGRAHFVRWYSERGQAWLAPRVADWAQRMGVSPSGLAVRDLGYRWGSCGKAGGVNFHWATLLLPPSIIDYVVVHELAHLFEANHTPEFWLRVARALPEFEQRKRWLAEKGGAVVGL